MSKWFPANKLALNLVTAYITTFIKNNSAQHTVSTGYKETYVEESVNTKSLGLQTDNHLHWKNHTNQLVCKLIGAC
jgi:hypothetical protein